MFHSFFFFNSLARSRYLSFFSHSFNFILWSARTAKLTNLQVLFFLLIIIRSCLLAEIWCQNTIGVNVCYFLGEVIIIVIIIPTVILKIYIYIYIYLNTLYAGNIFGETLVGKVNNINFHPHQNIFFSSVYLFNTHPQYIYIYIYN